MSKNQVAAVSDDMQQVADAELAAKGDLQELTFGEKAVGLTFNPSGNEVVEAIKSAYAGIIDMLHFRRTESRNPEVCRMYSVAITEAQTSQMWAVKAATWKH